MALSLQKPKDVKQRYNVCTSTCIAWALNRNTKHCFPCAVNMGY